MKQISTKRTVQLAHYKRVKAELEIELKDKGEWRCFFSGIPLAEDAPFLPHHLRGRDGDMLIEKEFLVPCLWEYHQKYHDVPFSKLKTEWWWNGFLERLKALDEDLWYSHVLKCER